MNFWSKGSIKFDNDIFTVNRPEGEFAKAYDGLAEKPANVTLCPTRDDLISLLKVSPVEHSLVLVKGSHGMGLEQALEAL